jgi:hypothetical protein
MSSADWDARVMADAGTPIADEIDRVAEMAKLGSTSA